METAVSGISAGTELLLFRDEVPSELPADETLDALEGNLSYPVRYGYAAVGRVAEIGAEVGSDWKGREVFAFNPHESSFAARPEDLIAVPEDLDREGMTLLPSLETATSLVLDGRPRIGERVVVFGAGVIGLCTIHLLSTFPLERLVAVEPIRERREHALRMGADVAVPPDEVGEAVQSSMKSPGSGTVRPSGEEASRKAVSNDKPGKAMSSDKPEKADLVFELSGSPAALDQAVDVTGFDGRVVVGSWYGTKRSALNLGTHFHRGRISIESSQVSTLSPESSGRYTKSRRMDLALERLREIDVSPLITHRIPFEEAASAYRLLDEAPESALHVLFTYK